MIASGTQCNDKWALQRAPLMNQRETFSHGALLVGLSHHGHSARVSVKPETTFFSIAPVHYVHVPI